MPDGLKIANDVRSADEVRYAGQPDITGITAPKVIVTVVKKGKVHVKYVRIRAHELRLLQDGLEDLLQIKAIEKFEIFKVADMRLQQAEDVLLWLGC